MINLADLPAALTVTNLRAEPLVIANLRFEPGKASPLPLNLMGDGYRSCVYQAVHLARLAGHVTVVPSTQQLADPVDSGHTLFGGHVAR